MKWIKHIIPPNSVKIIGWFIAAGGAIETLDYFTNWILPHKKIVFYLLLLVLLLLLIINGNIQRIKQLSNVEKLTAQVADITSQLTTKKEQASSDKETINNYKTLYENIKKENTELQESQIALNSIILSKNITFRKFIYELIEIDQPDANVVRVIHELLFAPSMDQELLKFGKQAIDAKAEARIEINAIESQIPQEEQK